MTPRLSLPPPADVLVLGAGLAGLAAARAALEAAPGSVVTVAAPQGGPSGSSFANMHDRLGLHAPATSGERQDFCREALALGRPGMVDEGLVKILAEEALERRQELEALGVAFVRDDTGAPRLFPACFSPQSRRAAVFGDLAHAYRVMADRVASLGGRLAPGLTAVSLLQESPGARVLGALCEDAAEGLAVLPARAVVAAMGGPASLFLHNQAGQGGTGTGHGILAAAGAALANTAYLQWMWARLPSRAFWPVWSLFGDAAFLLNRQGHPVPLPDTVRAASLSRADHCPLGHGLADAALDRFVLDHADTLGVADIQASAPGGGTERFQAALLAHAGNGGAIIDADGRTTVPGLFAAGECATGMHGANRLGGAMVAACLVFGARAGRAAATTPDHLPDLTRSLVAQRVHEYHRNPRQREAARCFLAHALQRHGLPRDDRHGLDLLKPLADRRRTISDILAVRMIDSALIFAQGRS
ncbi:FAD-binding protein [Desulfovibrio sulfodismutans]|uniref:FAD-binding protein n=1 Tax=Desulfolutivibrio sulfodismutans TaxID=63561 RepID=A0A7K3NJW4_9BACT|nr:FAD-binding protein [Desulfolutivibrio sulfodismutans]NDY56482.1 FAD-binding protein [Desulfolutivibrio sulfodismutans]QLA12782.1 FAD-dependent oxidoreductase [Desulfolutivibrio sulfodismutans DSM 3696]